MDTGRRCAVTDRPSWLPDLILLSSVDGDWSEYVEELYRFFRRDYLANVLQCRGVRVGLKRHPAIRGKEATFWHLISEGSDEAERTPDFRRCERIRWPRAAIDNLDDPLVLVWDNTRRGSNRLLLWLKEYDYLVVLGKRKNYYLLVTAYPVTRAHTRRKLEQEYTEYCRKG